MAQIVNATAKTSSGCQSQTITSQSAIISATTRITLRFVGTHKSAGERVRCEEEHAAGGDVRRHHDQPRGRIADCRVRQTDRQMKVLGKRHQGGEHDEDAGKEQEPVVRQA